MHVHQDVLVSWFRTSPNPMDTTKCAYSHTGDMKLKGITISEEIVLIVLFHDDPGTIRNQDLMAVLRSHSVQVKWFRMPWV